MTDDKEPVPFLTCLIHESKKAYLKYLLWICAAIDVVAGVAIISYIAAVAVTWYLQIIGPIQTAVWNWLVSGAGAVWSGLMGVLSGAYALLAAAPWWAWLGLAILLLPVAYASAVCIERRHPGTKDKAKTNATVVLACSLASCLIGCVFAFFVFVVNNGYKKVGMPLDYTYMDVAFYVGFAITMIISLLWFNIEHPSIGSSTYYGDDW